MIALAYNVVAVVVLVAHRHVPFRADRVFEQAVGPGLVVLLCRQVLEFQPHRTFGLELIRYVQYLDVRINHATAWFLDYIFVIHLVGIDQRSLPFLVEFFVDLEIQVAEIHLLAYAEKVGLVLLVSCIRSGIEVGGIQAVGAGVIDRDVRSVLAAQSRSLLNLVDELAGIFHFALCL